MALALHVFHLGEPDRPPPHILIAIGQHLADPRHMRLALLSAALNGATYAALLYTSLLYSTPLHATLRYATHTLLYSTLIYANLL